MVKTEDALLVIGRNHARAVRQIVAQLKKLRQGALLIRRYIALKDSRNGTAACERMISIEVNA